MPFKTAEDFETPKMLEAEKDFSEDVILKTHISFGFAGERQISASEIYSPIMCSAGVRHHAYLMGAPVRSTNKDNIQYIRNISGDDVTGVKAIAVHSAGEGDWITPTWNNLRLSLFYDVYRQPLSKITEARRLPDKWNSYDAHRISKETSFRAAEALIEAFLTFCNLGVNAIVPFVAPCPDGSIQLEWELKEKELEIVVPFSIDQKIRILKAEKEDIVEAVIDSLSEMAEYLMWLLRD